MENKNGDISDGGVMSRRQNRRAQTKGETWCELNM
jgi:hypothetical protein